LQSLLPNDCLHCLKTSTNLFNSITLFDTSYESISVTNLEDNLENNLRDNLEDNLEVETKDKTIEKVIDKFC